MSQAHSAQCCFPTADPADLMMERGLEFSAGRFHLVVGEWRRRKRVARSLRLQRRLGGRTCRLRISSANKGGHAGNRSKDVDSLKHCNPPNRNERKLGGTRDTDNRKNAPAASGRPAHVLFAYPARGAYFGG